MEIFPAIDLIGGSVVRLTQGEFDTQEVYSSEPVEVLRRFKEQGARNLHLVDLDGARNGSLANFTTVAKLVAEGGVFVEVGGGVRNEERIKQYLSIGVSRVILGTIAVTEPEFVRQMVSEYGEKIAVGVDVKDGFVATQGWGTVTQISGFELCQRCADMGVKTIIYTDISRDGAMRGTNLEAYAELKKIEGVNFVASGGVSGMDDILGLKQLGIYGAIVGKALYKGTLALDSVMAAADR